MGYWLKLYTDILDDRKYFSLSEKAKLGMYELMLVAKRMENGELTGKLPCVADIAFQTRKTTEEWGDILTELEKIGFVNYKNDTGKITNYVKRQNAIPANVRMKQYRKRRNNSVMEDETIQIRDSDEDVTNCNGEREEREDKKELTTASFFRSFQEKISYPLMGAKDTDYLKELLNDYGEQKVLEIADWCATKDFNSMWQVLRAIDTAAPNWNKPKKKGSGGEVLKPVGREFNPAEVL